MIYSKKFKRLKNPQTLIIFIKVSETTKEYPNLRMGNGIVQIYKIIYNEKEYK